MRSPTKVYWQQVGSGGSTRKRGFRGVNGGGAEKIVKAGGVSDMINKMVVQGSCYGDDGGSSVGKRGGSSTMASSLQQQKNKKTEGQFFGKRKLKLSTSSLLFLESPSCQENQNWFK